MTTEIQTIIETKNGTRIFRLRLGSKLPGTQETLKNFFTKKEVITLEELISFCIDQTEYTHQLQSKNKKLQDESLDLQKRIEELYLKLENL